MLNWNCTKEEHEIIRKIVKKAAEGISLDYLESIMDIEAVHCNGNPLQLKEFLKGKPIDFLHDFFGIMKNLDRTTGKLCNCFVPRFSR